MPNSKQHREQASHNTAFLAAIDVQRFPDWAAVVAFYAAVHLVERLRAKVGEHSINHIDRLAFLRRPAYRNTLFKAFHVLYNASLIARYETAGSFSSQFAPADVKNVLIDQHLASIDQHVAAEFAPPATN